MYAAAFKAAKSPCVQRSNIGWRIWNTCLAKNDERRGGSFSDVGKPSFYVVYLQPNFQQARVTLHQDCMQKKPTDQKLASNGLASNTAPVIISVLGKALVDRVTDEESFLLLWLFRIEPLHVDPPRTQKSLASASTNYGSLNLANEELEPSTVVQSFDTQLPRLENPKYNSTTVVWHY